jgi:hypothetical protein
VTTLLLSMIAAIPAVARAQDWIDRSQGLSPRSVRGLAVASDRWLAAAGGRLFESRDRGRIWRRLRGPARRGSPWAERRGESAPRREGARGFAARARSAFAHLRDRRELAAEPAAPEVLVPRRAAALTSAAIAPGLACAGGEAGLWCAGSALRFSRVRLGPDAAVHTLAPDPSGASRIVATGAFGLVLVGADGRARGGMQSHPLAAVSRQVVALGAHAGDLYAATRRMLWRVGRESLRPIQVPPGGGLRAVAVCRRRLFVATLRGLWRLAPLGWVRERSPPDVRALACDRGNLVAATSAGVWASMPEPRLRRPPRRADPGDLVRLVRAAWRREGLLGPSLESRARAARWLPRLDLVARVARMRDVRSPETVLLWPPPRWHHDPVLRVRGTSRAEVLVLATWPLGAAGPERSLREARRIERRQALRRRHVWHRIAGWWRVGGEAPVSEPEPLLASVRRRLLAAEAAAMIEGLGGGGR